MELRARYFTFYIVILAHLLSAYTQSYSNSVSVCNADSSSQIESISSKRNQSTPSATVAASALPTPLLTIDFNATDLTSGLLAVGNVEGYEAANVTTGFIPISSGSDGYGLIVQADPGQGAVIFGTQPVAIEPVAYLKVLARTNASGAQLALAGLNTSTNQLVIDGQLGYTNRVADAVPVNQDRTLNLLYQPPAGAVVPYLQIVVPPDAPSSVTIYFDRLTVSSLSDCPPISQTIDLQPPGDFESGTVGMLQNVAGLEKHGLVDISSIGNNTFALLSLYPEHDAANLGILAQNATLPETFLLQADVRRTSGSGGTCMLILTNGLENIGLYIANSELGNQETTIHIGGDFETPGAIQPLAVVQNAGPGIQNTLAVDDIRLGTVELDRSSAPTPTPTNTPVPTVTPTIASFDLAIDYLRVVLFDGDDDFDNDVTVENIAPGDKVQFVAKVHNLTDSDIPHYILAILVDGSLYSFTSEQGGSSAGYYTIRRSPPWSSLEEGEHTVESKIAVEGDSNPDNNTAQITFTVGTTAPTTRPTATLVPSPTYTPTSALTPTQTSTPIPNFTSINAHGGGVNSIEYSRDGMSILSGGMDRTAKLWDLEAASLLQTFSGHKNEIWSVSFSPDGLYVVTASQDKSARLWDALSGKLLQKFTSHKKPVFASDYSTIDNSVLTGGDDGRVRLWSADSGRETSVFTGHKAGVTAVAFSTGGGQILSGSDDNTAILWDVQSKERLQTFTGHTGRISDVLFVAEGNRVLTASWDGNICLWDTNSGEVIRTFSGHESAVNAIDITPDGSLLLSGGEDHTLRLWNTESGNEIRILQGHTGPVTSVGISPLGMQAASGSEDGTLKIWDIEEIPIVPTSTPTSTPSPTVTPAPTDTPTSTPTRTHTPTSTSTPTRTSTPTPTFTPSPTSPPATPTPNNTLNINTSKHIPDQSLRDEIEMTLIFLGLDLEWGGPFTPADVALIEEFYLPADVQKMKGSEYLINLRYLDVSAGYDLATLDCSPFANLETLSVSWGDSLKNLDLSSNRALRTLTVTDNPALTQLDLSHNLNLEELECVYNSSMTQLILPSGSQLRTAEIYNNALTTLDFGDNDHLEEVDCYGNALTDLDVSGCEGLRILYCDLNQLTDLDLSNNHSLVELSCEDNSFAHLDVASCQSLEKLYCGGNSLSELCVTQNPLLTNLLCADNQLQQLDVSSNNALYDLECSDNMLVSLDLSNTTGLAWLYCPNNQLTELFLENQTELRWLYAYGNRIASIAVSPLCPLREVFVNDNNLTSIAFLAENQSTDWIRADVRNNLLDCDDWDDVEEMKSRIGEAEYSSEFLNRGFAYSPQKNLDPYYCGPNVDLEVVNVYTSLSKVGGYVPINSAFEYVIEVANRGDDPITSFDYAIRLYGPTAQHEGTIETTIGSNETYTFTILEFQGLVASMAGELLHPTFECSTTGDMNTSNNTLETTFKTYDSRRQIFIPGLSSYAKQMEMVFIHPGTFTMGSPTWESGRESSERAHEVTITKGFYIGKYEVTQAQYKAVIGYNPSEDKDHSDQPVESLTWYDSINFCHKLEELLKGDSEPWRRYLSRFESPRLPTEAEWEYACRAGTTTKYSFGSSSSQLSDYAVWQRGFSGAKKVGLNRPNPWGLYDMHGNIKEWVSDWYDIYPTSPQTDPTGPSYGTQKVLRGGDFSANSSEAAELRSASRRASVPTAELFSNGFRIVIELDESEFW